MEKAFLERKNVNVCVSFFVGRGSDPSEQSHHSARCTRLWIGQATRRGSQLNQEEVPTGRLNLKR